MYDRKHTHTTRTPVNRQTDKECACRRPRLLQMGFKMLFFRSFVKCHERATAWLFHVGASQNYCVSHLSSRLSDCGLTMQASRLKDKPKMKQVSKGHTPEVVGRHRKIIRIYAQNMSCTCCRVLNLTKLRPRVIELQHRWSRNGWEFSWVLPETVRILLFSLLLRVFPKVIKMDYTDLKIWLFIMMYLHA